MTIEELRKIHSDYVLAHLEQGNGNAVSLDAMREVVRVLRDELCVFYEDEMVIRDTWELYQEFNEILGVAESEKASGSGPASVHTQEQRPDPQVAGGANAVDAQQCQTNTTPATDAAPAVCVWTRISEFDTVVHYSTPHGVMNDLNLWRGSQCAMCHAPIKFTEANHG